MNLQELKANVDTIVIVMMENRSFDHVYGSLRLPQYGGRAEVNGIRALDSLDYANSSPSNEPIYPFMMKDGPFVADIPHRRELVATQLDLDANDDAQMDGFVKAYYAAAQTSGVANPPPMGLLAPGEAPMSAFLAKNYTLCDNWFCPIPTSTSPNRLMAMCGDSVADQTTGFPIPDQRTLYHWLTDLGVPWRVYHEGLPFLTLMKSIWQFLPMRERFRRFSELANDVQNEPDATWPKVVFVEPDYYDSPIRLSGQPCDNHAPMPMAYGEGFLRRVYTALTQNAARWKKTVMIYAYDEHGGFFDHVSPAKIPYTPPSHQYPPFRTTGPRVPAVIVSPMADATVRHDLLDHTSILQFLAERFGDPANPITPNVTIRRQAGISSVSALLNAGLSRTNLDPAPAIPPPGPEMMPAIEPLPHDLQIAFADAVLALTKIAGWAIDTYPEITAWLHGRR